MDVSSCNCQPFTQLLELVCFQIVASHVCCKPICDRILRSAIAELQHTFAHVWVDTKDFCIGLTKYRFQFVTEFSYVLINWWY